MPWDIEEWRKEKKRRTVEVRTPEGEREFWGPPKRKLTFEEWKKRADDAAVRRAGISLDDLADQPYYDWYEDGMSPEKAAKRALAAEGFPL